MHRTVLVAGDIGDQELVPEEINDALGGTSGASRIGPRHALIDTRLSAREVVERLTGCTRPYAVGASAVWQHFPELRDAFVISVHRSGFSGMAIKQVRLREVIAGDRQVGTAIRFAPRAPNEVVGEPFELPDKALSTFLPALCAPAHVGEIDVSGHDIYLVKNLSFSRGSSAIAGGIRFITADDLVMRSNFSALIQHHQNSSPVPMNALWMPEDFSGAFLYKNNTPIDHRFPDALISRILAAAALTSNAVASIQIQTYLDANRLSYNARHHESWYMPFAGGGFERVTIDDGDNIFWPLMDIISLSTPQKFTSAKEDYRSLSLETVADGRHSHVTALRYVQVWMGIERLLPVGRETTQQLALCLTALTASCDRVSEFKTIKELYDIRSKIAHGYGFKRDDTMDRQFDRISGYYRRLLIMSLNYGKADDFIYTLQQHVLSGQPTPIDALPP